MLPLLLAAVLAASAEATPSPSTPSPPMTSPSAAIPPAGAPPGAKIIPYGDLKAVDERMYGRSHRMPKGAAGAEAVARRHAPRPLLRPKFALKDDVKFSK